MPLRHSATTLVMFLLVLSPAMLHPSLAQDSAAITGRVVDNESIDSLPGATVTLWVAADTTMVSGIITDVDGRFSLPDVRFGTYLMQVSFIGYQHFTSERFEISAQGQRKDFGTISLKARPTELDGVEIVGDRDLVTVEVDRTSYAIKADPTLRSGDGTDALESVPSLEIDGDGTILLRGNSNVVVLINGRPAPVPGSMIQSYLEQLPASMIDRVEVMTTPSAEFDPDGKTGIVNIVLDRSPAFKRSGSIQTDAASNEDYGVKGALNVYTGDWSILANYTLQLKDDDFFHNIERLNRASDPMSEQTQRSHSLSDVTGHLGALTLSNNLSSRVSLTAYGVYSTSATDYTVSNRLLDVAVPDDVIDRNIRAGIGDRSGNSFDARLELRDVIETGKRESLVALRLSGSQGTEFDQIRSSSGTEVLVLDNYQELDVSNDNLDAELELQHRRKLGSVQLTAGYNGEFGERSRDFYSERGPSVESIAPEADLNNDFTYTLATNTLYAELSNSWGKWSAQAGLRAEQALSEFELITTGEQFDNDYASLFPSGFLLYEFSPAYRARLAYSKRINRPSAGRLNPFPSNFDRLNRYVGNPRLGPEYAHSLELTLTQFGAKHTLTLAPYYSVTVDRIDFHIFLEDDITVITFGNFDQYATAGLEGVLSVGPYRGFRYRVSTNIRRDRAQDGNVVQGLEETTTSWEFRQRFSYSGPKGLSLSANVNTYSDRHGFVGKFDGRTRINMAATRPFWNDKLEATVRAYSIITGNGFFYTIDEPTYRQDGHVGFDGQRVQLSLRLRIGSMKSPAARPNTDIQVQSTGAFL